MDFFLSYIYRLSTTELVLIAAITLLFIIQLCFFLFIYIKPYLYEKKRVKNSLPDSSLPPISVIIASKDNAEELGSNLPYILEQDYPQFEVIVVNSGSADDSDLILNAAKQKYPNLYNTFIPAEADGINEKKLALTLGIKAAKYDILLFTEPYCRPSGSNWIREYGKGFANGKDILLGYTGLSLPKKLCCSGFIRYDNLIEHLRFLAMAIVGKPFMGIGRNMAYRKELFFDNKGYSSILGVDGGEDDLFINHTASKYKTGVLLSPESIMNTDSVTKFSTWRLLKSKHIYTGQFYKGLSTPLFGLEIISKNIFYLLLIVSATLSIAMSNYFCLGFSLLLFLIRFIVQLIVINKNSMLLDNRRFNINLLLFDIFHSLNNRIFKKYANRRYGSRHIVI